MHVQKRGSFVEIEGSHDSGVIEMTAYLRTVAAPGGWQSGVVTPVIARTHV
jgi:hypothetical protein